MSKPDWTADELLKRAGNYWEACTIQAGVWLDIFTLLGNEFVAGNVLAQRIDADLRGVTILCNALAAIGLLIKKGDQYANTPAAKTFLVKQSPKYLGYMIKHFHQVLDAWSKLPEAAKTGSPVRQTGELDDQERENFLMGMFNMAMGIAPRAAKQIDLSGRRQLLDLGGGPGTYAIHFCQANPQLRATIYDLPTTKPFALRTVAQFNLADRIDFKAGNYLEEDLQGSYDVAWLSHILHGEGPDDCRRIIEKTVAVLESGGLIMIHDFILADTLDGPLFPALFSLNMLINTPKGQSYSQAQIKAMLAGAGVKDIRALPFKGFNDTAIISGKV